METLWIEHGRTEFWAGLKIPVARTRLRRPFVHGLPWTKRSTTRPLRFLSRFHVRSVIPSYASINLFVLRGWKLTMPRLSSLHPISRHQHLFQDNRQNTLPIPRRSRQSKFWIYDFKLTSQIICPTTFCNVILKLEIGKLSSQYVMPLAIIDATFLKAFPNQDASQAWDGQYPLYQRESGVQVEHIRVVGRSRPQDVVAQLVEWWNELFFRPRGTQAVLCQEISPDHPTSPSFAIYLLDLTVQTVGQDGTAGVVARFGSVPEGLDRIDVFDPPDSANSGRPSGRTMIFAGPHEAHVHWRRGTPIAQRYDPGSSIQTRESESRGSSPGRDLTRFEGGVEEDDEPEPAESEQNSVNYVHFQQV